ncbi:insulinase family protein [bacterium]|nr:MAG: insulinase family protein [bacterium]
MATRSTGVVREILPNGLRVLVEPLSDFSSVSVGVWILNGSRDEEPAKAGISHLIEHLSFKGTPTRGARQIALEIDSLGGSLNAFTSKEYTSFYARVLGNTLHDAMDILGDITLNPLFQENDLVKERDVIIQEISMVEDTPEDLVHDLHSREFWSGHGLGWSILGTQRSVMGMTTDDIHVFHRDRYRAGSMVLTAAGAVDPEKLLTEIGRIFGHLARGTFSPVRPTPDPTPGIHVLNRPLEQVHFCVGFESMPVNDDRRYQLYLLNTILGGGMSSRLFQRIREERGLAYSVYSYHSPYQDTGLLTVYCGTSPDGFPTALGLVHEEIERLVQESVQPEDLVTAKRQLKGNLLLSLESTGNRMNQLARNEIYFGRQIPPNEIEDGIESVTAGKIQDLAGEIFKTDSRAMTVIGPVQEENLGAD